MSSRAFRDTIRAKMDGASIHCPGLRRQILSIAENAARQAEQNGLLVDADEVRVDMLPNPHDGSSLAWTEQIDLARVTILETVYPDQPSRVASDLIISSSGEIRDAA